MSASPAGGAAEEGGGRPPESHPGSPGGGTAGSAAEGEGYRSGFVAIMGRPNVGKSSLVNRMVGEKVTITSKRPQTTRTQIRGVLTGPEVQIVFVDTPGVHKPRTLMGTRLNQTAFTGAADVDVVCMVVDATAPIGTGDLFVAGKLPDDLVLVVNKIDRVGPEELLTQLRAAAQIPASDYFPVSARTGEGVDELLSHLSDLMPVGPKWYPDEMTSDTDDATWVAELVREQLLSIARDELPHSIACRVVEFAWPRIRVEILVERESQKPIVIGKGGSVLKEVGTKVRRQLRDGAYLELVVRVRKDWQRNAADLERLGY